MAKTALLFPGQGAQHVGMGVTIAEKHAPSRELFQSASEILGYDLLEVCRSGPKEHLDKTEVSQPALFVASLAALELVREEEPEIIEDCVVSAGLSLGEYTALAFSGVFDFETGLKLVETRGKAMQAAADATPSGMVSLLLLDVDVIEEICQEAEAAGMIKIANFLCPGNTVVSGEKAACELAAKLGEAKGGRAIPLAVAGAFHTDLMKPADETLRAAVTAAEFKPPRIPVISNVDAQAHESPEEIRNLLVKQVISPVRWEDSVRSMLAQGIDGFYEIGPGKVLKGLLKRIDRKANCELRNDS